MLIRHFLNPPNWFTSASLLCSVSAISGLLAPGDPTPELLVRACVLVVFGGIFDLLDGRVARITRRDSAFGVQLDSIADMVGFGVCPALIAWTWKLHELGTLGVAITFWYVLATAFRLARFNVAKASETWPFAGHSEGLTSTLAGGILVTFIWVCNGYLADTLRPSAAGVAGLLALLGYLMVSSLPFRNFRDLSSNRSARRYLAVCLSCCLVAALTVDLSMWWGAGALLYLVVGMIDGVAVALIHDRLAAALLLTDQPVDDAPDTADVEP
jgi:CDP-diacylglycerol--serine O-phosphatidyltransferase